MPGVGIIVPVLPQLSHCVQDDGRLLRGTDRTTLAPVRLNGGHVPGSTGDVHGRHQAAAARHPDAQAGRLGDDGRVRLQPMGDGGYAARTGRLLVGHGTDDEVAAKAHSTPVQGLDGDEDGRDPTLHVHGPPTVEPPLTHRGPVGIDAPQVTRLGRDRINVTVEQQPRSAARTRDRSEQLRETGPEQSGGHLTGGRHLLRSRLPQVNEGSSGRHPLAHVVLQLRLVVRNPGVHPGCRLESGEINGRAQHRVRVDGVEDVAFQCAQCHGTSWGEHAQAIDT